MDQTVLVANGQKLLDLMDSTSIRPRAAMWVHNTDTDAWRLWIVPDQQLTDRREFYRKVSELIADNKAEVPNIDAGDVEMTPDSHPAITGLSAVFGIIGKSDVHVSNNILNGYYLPDGIILRMQI